MASAYWMPKKTTSDRARLSDLVSGLAYCGANETREPSVRTMERLLLHVYMHGNPR